MWSAWWYCWHCVRAFHVPTTGYFGTCNGCGRPTVAILSQAAEPTEATVVRTT